MAKLPTDLSKQWWINNKAKTLKDTGLGNLLGQYEMVGKKCQDPKERTVALLDEVSGALENVARGVETQKSACNPKLHKETMDALSAYPALLKKAKDTVALKKGAYLKIIDDWEGLRKNTIAELQVLNRDVDELLKRVETCLKVCEKASKVPSVPREPLVADAKGLSAQLKDNRKSLHEAMEMHAKNAKAVEAPHPKDRSTDYLSEIGRLALQKTAACEKAIVELEKAIEALGVKLTVGQPSDLSANWWQANMAKLLPNTGMEKLLGQYESVWKECLDPKQRSRKSFNQAYDALLKVNEGLEKVKRQCPTQKEILQALEGYTSLINKARGALTQAAGEYAKVFTAWLEQRKNIIAGLKERQGPINTLMEKAKWMLETVKAKPALRKAVVKDMKATSEELGKKRVELNAYLAAKMQEQSHMAKPHADEQTDGLRLQNEIRDIMKVLSAALQKALESLKIATLES